MYVADGTYAFTEPLTLEPIDSGTAQTPIAYQAAAGAHPVFSGGRVLTGWRPAENGIWKTACSGSGRGPLVFRAVVRQRQPCHAGTYAE